MISREKRPLELGPPPPAAGASSLRVAVADLESIFRTGLLRVLVSADLEVVSEIDHLGGLVSEPARLQPDVMFVQHEMLVPNNGALGAIREASPATKLVVTASAFGDDDAVALVEAGACGVILKGAQPALFIKCAHKVAEGEVWLPKKLVAAVARRLSEHGTRSGPMLTAREKVVINCLLQTGWHNREIAQHLSVTHQTVKNYLRSVYHKVGVTDRAGLVLYATRHRLDLTLLRDEAIT